MIKNKRQKKENTGLFFDSFKHFKHNLSNLLCVELPTLCAIGAQKYLSLIETNYKSKYPDMRKIGLIEYDKPSDNKFTLTEEAQKLLAIVEPFSRDKIYDENIIKQGRKNIDSIPLKPFIIFARKNAEYKSEILKLVLSYYDSADLIRPYLTLLNFIRHYKIKTLDTTILQNILANTKDDILNLRYKEKAFESAQNEIQTEIKRPISYIYNFLKTALIMDSNERVIVDFRLVDRLQNDMNAVVLYESIKARNSRPAREQKAFRDNVLKAYNYKCAISGKAIWIGENCLLEAAHIIPYRDGGSFSVNNGIALSYEMHKMFDKGLFGFVSDGSKIRIKISQSAQISDKDLLLQNLSNKPINLPKNIKDYPDSLALEYNIEKFLLR